MEEPDLDELEWMACEQLPPEDDADYYFDDIPPPQEPPGDVNGKAGKFSHENSFRKRSWDDEDSAHPGVSGNAVAKKIHLLHSDTVGDASKASPLVPPDSSTEDAWSPPSPPDAILKTNRNTFSTLSAEKPWSPPPPSRMEEGRPVSSPGVQGECNSEVEPPIPCKLPHRRAADIDGDYISITGHNGERVYAAKAEPIKLSYNAVSVYGKGLLGEPISKMIERLERENFEQVVAASEKKNQQGGELETEPVTKHEDLWVDNYAPRSFTELLSDEQTNREVLRWLKQWDPCVFGATKHSTSEEVLTSLRRQVTQTQRNGYSGGNSFNKPTNRNMPTRDEFTKPEPLKKVVATEPSTLDRPEEKVLLLCGPPGLGKTTLAHVAARHCGYRVVEINASDDRVATTLQEKIMDAIQMRSVMGDSRPNCLVIDEIDGALNGAEGKGAIDALLEIINAEKKLSQGKENDSEEGFTRKSSRKKGGPAVRRLSRPVVCICNDLYAPALRSLRQIARVHVFVQPSISRVVSRLKYICGKEGYKTNARALSALASHTECDIRSCLNTLQFLNCKGQNLKTLDVGSQVIGRKDMTSSIFDIWGEVFHRRKTRPGAVKRGMVDMPESGNRDHKDLVRLYGLFSNHGDFELSMDGIHENILHMRYHDASLHKTVEALKWMGDSEIFSHRIMAKQQFHLLAYQPSTLIAIRGLVAQQERPQVEWPRSYQKCRTEKAVKTEMLSSWLAAMAASVSRTLSPSCLALDMVTPLLSILTPPTIRPVAAQLLTPKEKEEITQLVDTMLEFGISYRHPKSGMLKAEYGLEGQSVLSLDPPIDSLVNYTDQTLGHRQLSSILRQMLAHEVDLEHLRREGAVREAKMGATTPMQVQLTPDGPMKKDQGQSKPLLKQLEGQPKLNAVRTGILHKTADSIAPKESTAEEEKPQPRQPTNFFERFKRSAQTGVSADVKAKDKRATLQRDSRPLLYKFHEGFTNAVKRPMLVRDFL